MFMPEQTAVVEVLPPTFGIGGFRELSKMRQLSYFSMNSVWVEDWENETGVSNGKEYPLGMKVVGKKRNSRILRRGGFIR
jgi:hypothetical protein